MMAQRILWAVLACFAQLSTGLAQPSSSNIPIVGWLRPSTTETVLGEQLRKPLASLGLIDGQNIRLDIRLADGQLDRLPGLAEALVREGASVIVASGDVASRAAQNATKTIPIIAIGDDLVGAGLIPSLARP